MNPPQMIGWITALFDWAWQASVAATVVFLLVWVLTGAFRTRLSPYIRYGLLFVVLVRFLLPVAPESSISLANLLKPARLEARPELIVTHQAAVVESRDPFPIVSSEIPVIAQKWQWKPLLAISWAVVAILMGVSVILRQRRFAREVRSLPAFSEPAILSLLGDCKHLLQCRANVTLRESPDLGIPVVFGLFKPVIILPSWIVAKGPSAQVRSILLHELAHVRRWDAALNWVVILARTVHWFNPAAWWATRMFVAERELVCDAIALRALDPEFHADYGHALIEAASHPVPGRPLPVSSSAILHRSQIERRIKMIRNVTKPSVVSGLAAACLGAVVAAITFTSAAVEQKEPAPSREASPVEKRQVRGSHADEGSRILKRELENAQEHLQAIQEQVDRLRRELPDAALDASAMSERIREIHKQIGAVEDQHRTMEGTLQTLQKLAADRNIEAITSFVEDANLTDLMRTQYNLEQEMTRKVRDFGEGHPVIQELRDVSTRVQKQIGTRVQGILDATLSRALVLESQKGRLEKALQEAIRAQVNHNEKTRPYHAALRNLENQQRIVDTIKLRWLAEMVDAKLTVQEKN